jgi:carboxyl-terminal processing protease
MFYLDTDLKTIKEMFKKFYILLVLSAALACKASPGDPVKFAPGDLQPDQKQSLVCKEVASLISQYNYKKVNLNDSLSSAVYTPVYQSTG